MVEMVLVVVTGEERIVLMVVVNLLLEEAFMRQAVAAYFLHLGWWQPCHNIVVSVMVSSNCCIGSTGCCWEMTEDGGFLVACSKTESNKGSQSAGNASLIQVSEICCCRHLQQQNVVAHPISTSTNIAQEGLCWR
jgi:hypothetical protein